MIAAYAAGGALAVGLAVGGWIGHGMGAERYLDGFHAGVKSQQALSDAETRRLLAEMNEKAAQAQREAAAAILIKEREQNAALQQAEADHAENARKLSASVDVLRRRVRLEQSAAANRSRANRVPAAAADAVIPDAADTRRDILAAGDELLRLAEAAEREAGRYGSCYRWAKLNSERSP